MQRIHIPFCQSTNQMAFDMSSKIELAEGTVIWTSHQTHGRGLVGSWEAEKGKNITCSLILKPEFIHSNQAFFINIIVSLGVLQMLARIIPDFSQSIKIKWPNDIYFQSKKLGGILIQNQIKSKLIKLSVVGIGLNINQLNFKTTQNAISLHHITGQVFSVERLIEMLQKYVMNLYDLFRSHNYQGAFKHSFEENMFKRNEINSFQDKKSFFSGEILGIDDLGRMLIHRNDGNIQAYHTKEVIYRSI